MKTKKLTLLSHMYTGKGFNKPLKVTLTVPEGIWFNVEYDLRGKLYEATKMTTAQFLTTSNQNIWEVLKMMKPAQLKMFKEMLKCLSSKRAEVARFLVEKLESEQGK